MTGVQTCALPISSPKERHKHSNNSVAYPKSSTIDYFAQGGTQALQQLGHLPQERHDRLRCPRRSTNTPTTRSPTPRVVRSTTSPKKRHKHSNSSVAYPKSGTINYFAQRGTQSLKQLGPLPQERYDRLLRLEKSISTTTTRSPTPRVV